MKNSKVNTFLYAVIIVLISIILAGCNNSRKISYDGMPKVNYKFPDSTNITSGTKVSIHIGSETSDNGNIPILKVDKDNFIVGEQLTVSNFDKDTDIYILIKDLFVNLKVGMKKSSR